MTPAEQRALWARQNERIRELAAAGRSDEEIGHVVGLDRHIVAARRRTHNIPCGIPKEESRRRQAENVRGKKYKADTNDAAADTKPKEDPFPNVKVRYPGTAELADFLSVGRGFNNVILESGTLKTFGTAHLVASGVGCAVSNPARLAFGECGTRRGAGRP